MKPTVRPHLGGAGPIDEEAEIAPASARMGSTSASGGLISVMAQVLMAVIQFAAMAALARLLAPEDFGLIAMAATISGAIAMFSELGLSTAAIQVERLDDNLASAFFRLNVALGILIAVVLTVTAPLVAQLFGDPRLVEVIELSSGPIVITAFVRQHGAILQRQMKWLIVAGIALASSVAGSVVAIVAAAVLDWGYLALIAQSYASALVAAGLTLHFCAWRPGKVTDWKRIREPLSFGLHLTGFSFLNYFHRQFDDALVGCRWGAGPLGQYNRAYVLLLLPTNLVAAPLARTALPAMSRARSDPGQWQAVYLPYLFVVTATAGLAGCYFFVFAQQFARLAFGPGWHVAGDILRYLAVSMPAAGAMHTAGTAYSSVGDARGMNRWAFVSVPILVASYIVGLPFGPEKVALCYSVAVIGLLFPCLSRAIAKAPIALRPVVEVVSPPLVAALAVAAAADFLVTPGFAIVDGLVFAAALPAYCGLTLLLLSLTETGREIRRMGIDHLRFSRALAFTGRQ